MSASVQSSRQFIEKTSRELEKVNSQTAAEAVFQALLSQPFLQGIAYLDVQEKFELSNKLLQRIAFFGASEAQPGGMPEQAEPLEKTQVVQALAALIQGNKKELVQACDAVADHLLHATPKPRLVETLCDPPVARVLGLVFPPECLDMFLHGLERDLAELLPEDADKKSFLDKFPVLTDDLGRSMTWLMDEWQKWLSLQSEEQRAASEAVNELIDSFSYLRDSPRIKLFYKHVAELKESFLTSLAVTLREVLRKDEANAAVHSVHTLRALAEELQLEYFYLAGGGVVMYRWLEKQTLKYADIVTTRAKVLASESVVLHAELKSRLLELFASPEDAVSVQLPFAADKKIVEFVNDHLDVLTAATASSGKVPRGAVTAKAAVEIFGLFPDLFSVDATSGRATHLLKAAAAGTAGGGGGESLADILLREMVERIPRSVFSHKAAPIKRGGSGPGVYWVGHRECVFLSKAGKLYLQMPNIPVDAAEFLSREYGVPYATLLPPAHATAGGTGGAGGGGGRPIDYSDARFLYRVIRAGFKAKDEYWKNLWKQYAEHEKIPKLPKQQNNLKVLAKFVERNVSYVARKDWSRRFLAINANANANISDAATVDHGTGWLPPLHADSGSEEEDQHDRALPAHLVASEDNPFYKTRKCIAFQAGKCTRGAKCTYAHSEAELRAGPAFVPPPPQPTNHFARLAPTPEMLEEKEKRKKTNEPAMTNDLLPPVTLRAPAPGAPARTRSRSPRMATARVAALAPKKKLIDDDDL